MTVRPTDRYTKFMSVNADLVNKNVAQCRNCTSDLTGLYCHACGQKHVEGRLNTATIFSQLFEALTESDGTLWTTLRKLLRNPGKVSLDYINGTRASYLNPIRFFLVTFTIYLGLMVLSGAQLNIASRAYQPVLTGNTDIDSLSEAMSTAVTDTVASRMDLVILLVIPFLTFLIRWLFWWTNRNYAEAFTFICFVSGMGFLYGSVIIPIEYALDIYSSIPKNLITLALFLIGARTFFGIGWPSAIIGSIASAILYLLSVFAITTLVSFAVVFIERL